jgi:putative ABC transport system ATP-binding protein
MSALSHHPMIQVDSLGKKVISPAGELVILHDVNLTILSAEAVAIIGASGSGKSTLLGLMAGLDVPSSGQVFLDGVDLFSLDEDGRAEIRRNMIGFVFQSFQLLPNLTALENVMLPIELSGRQQQARTIAQEILSRVGLASRLQHYPRQLSGGEQQRVAIARAFAAEPKLLFADEPTGNLDQVTGERIIELLFDINRERATTLVLVTHDETLSGRCSRSLHLDAGRIVTA